MCFFQVNETVEKRIMLTRTAQRRGVAIFVRSVYLQGLILMPECDVPAHLQAVIPVRRKLEALAAEAGLGMTELALRYMFSQQGVTCIITGVESLDQIRQNIALFSKGPLETSLRIAAAQAVTDLPESVLSPVQWPQRHIGPTVPGGVPCS